MDNAVCGGAGAKLSGAALDAVKAAIFMGDPHNVVGLPYNVGTCKAQGLCIRLDARDVLTRLQFSARPKGFSCGAAATKIKSYCDSEDPYCCKGSSAQAHQAYVKKYGSEAMSFIKAQIKV